MRCAVHPAAKHLQLVRMVDLLTCCLLSAAIVLPKFFRAAERMARNFGECRQVGQRLLAEFERGIALDVALSNADAAGSAFSNLLLVGRRGRPQVCCPASSSYLCAQRVLQTGTSHCLCQACSLAKGNSQCVCQNSCLHASSP